MFIYLFSEGKMLKRLITLLLCASLILLITPLSSFAPEVSADEYSFGDRILYGGIAVDVGDDIYYSENGSIFKKTLDGKIDFIAQYNAKYLNYYNERIWFISDNSVVSIALDGSDAKALYKSDSEITCLYVAENKIFYLNGNAVCTYSDGREKILFEREGIKGFVPLSDGSFKWVESNPDYKYIDPSSGEVFEHTADEFISYIATPDTEKDEDILFDSASCNSYDTEATEEASTYNGPYVQVGDVTLPLENHMPGTFFSKNGRACTCHNTSSNYCILSVGNCNCMRYYPTGYSETCEIDLLGAQCFAFARMVFYTCFGFIDHPMNQSLYYNVGGLSSGAVTANSVKALFQKAGTGAHVRLSAGHSVSILTMDEDFIVIYHGNAGGNGVTAQPCIVSTRRYTWAEFAAGAAAKGIDYVNMPYNHPDSEVIATKKEVGFYRLNSNLNLRAENNTQSESLTIIPKEAIIPVTEIDGFWGKTVYNGVEGWVFLEYTTFYSHLGISPSGNVFKLGEDGYLRGAVWELDADTFAEHFDRQNISVADPDGNPLDKNERIGTGYTVSITIDGEIIDSATVCIAGDLNSNSRLDVGDYLILRASVLGKYTLSSDQAAAGDANGDGKIDAFDYAIIKRYFFNPDITLFENFG